MGSQVTKVAESAYKSVANGLAYAREQATGYVRAARNMARRYWRRFCAWVSQPHIIFALKIIGIIILVTLLVVFCVYTFGFGPAGIVAGSAAAATQSALFGASVTAGSWFSIMTSLGMTGGIFGVGFGLGVLTAMFWAFYQWFWGAGANGEYIELEDKTPA